MRVSALKKKYPELFSHIEQAVLEEQNRMIPKVKNFAKYCDNPSWRKVRDVIAYNAAVYAVSQFDKIQKHIGSRFEPFAKWKE